MQQIRITGQAPKSHIQFLILFNEVNETENEFRFEANELKMLKIYNDDPYNP